MISEKEFGFKPHPQSGPLTFGLSGRDNLQKYNLQEIRRVTLKVPHCHFLNRCTFMSVGPWEN